MLFLRHANGQRHCEFTLAPSTVLNSPYTFFFGIWIPVDHRFQSRNGTHPISRIMLQVIQARYPLRADYMFRYRGISCGSKSGTGPKTPRRKPPSPAKIFCFLFYATTAPPGGPCRSRIPIPVGMGCHLRASNLHSPSDSQLQPRVQQRVCPSN
ncbi:hypothetical protein B0H16DRAFT_220970 [Mycena metata]|uniref:Uncharacterized protein n=1 Tax=Mycena metata TaxID=1033252 RepID=A0AAD7HXC4_9AGAR|nr:hypothetical protein B0H16DRAFT_220970 [Mycena metata]